MPAGPEQCRDGQFVEGDEEDEQRPRRRRRHQAGHDDVAQPLQQARAVDRRGFLLIAREHRHGGKRRLQRERQESARDRRRG